ncbi:MAG: DUF3794 domain-containing protein [Clostridia bacterium]|nr:DUF3794 domain-containing protein [Clostridia bacterium]
MDNRNTDMPRTGTEFLLTPEGQRPQVGFFKKNLTTELSSDYTLPDYLPEIRKMLGVNTRISPVSRYIGNNGIEFSGRVDYDVIYVGGDGRLTCAPLGTDFSFEVQPDIPDGIKWDSSGDAYADIETDMLHTRVTAPRKLNIKCRLRAFAHAYSYEDVSLDMHGHTMGAEKLTNEVSCSEIHRHMSEVIELSDEIDTGWGADITEVILSNGNVKIVDSDMSIGDGNRLNCRGEVIADIVYKNTESGELRKETRRIPFSETIEAEIDRNMTSSPIGHNVRGICGEIKTTPSDGKILLDTEVILEGESAENIPLRLTEDIFIPGGKCKTEYRPFTFSEVKKCANCETVAKGTYPLSDISASEGCEIVETIPMSVRVEEINTDENTAVMNGKCKVMAITRNGDEFSSGEVYLPFSYNTGINTSGEKLIITSRPFATSCRAKCDGGNMSIEADITLPICALSEKTVRIAQSLECENQPLTKTGGITVYYPEKSEKLWDIAKKFGISLRNLAEANDLPMTGGRETPSGKNYMIIY